MSLESAIADLVSASTQLTQSVNVTRAAVEATRDSVLAQETPTETAKVATATAATAATASAATTASKLTTAAEDYAAQKVTKGLAAVQTAADTELKDRLHRRDPARHPFRGARPSLVMDFVRQECHRNNAAGNLEPVDLNSFMTFTRASTATVVGPDGLIKEVASNVPRYGYDPVTGEALGLLIEKQRTNLTSVPVGPVFYAWDTRSVLISRSNLISPSGMLDAIKVYEKPETATEFYLRASAGTLTAQTLCMSVYVHSSSKRTLQLRAVHESCALPTSEVLFVMATKTFGSSSGYITSSGYVDAGNGWYRVWIVFTTPSTSVVKWGANLIGGTTTGDGVSGVYLWGFQLEAGSFPTSYIPTPATFTGRASTKTYFDSNGVLQTAASGVAVTDYGYVDGRWVSKGLSLEPQATNLIHPSNFTTNSGAFTVTPNYGVSPAGTTSASRLLWSTTANGYIYASHVNSVAGATYTASIYIKPLSVGTRVSLFVGRADSASKVMLSIDLTACTGTVKTYNSGTNTISGVGYTLTLLPSGFIKATLTSTHSEAMSNFTAGVVANESGDSVTGDVLQYGLQLETGPVATSYIPTTTAQVTRAADTSTSAQVTRAADSAVSTQAAALYNLDAGTTCVEAKYSNRGTYPGLYSWDNDYFIFTSAISNALILNGRGSAGTMGLTSPAVDTTLRHAVQRNRLNLKSAVNNSALTGTSLSLSPTTTVPMLRLGVGNDPWNGYIKQLTYFPRQLSDADLQALTILED